MEKRRLSLVFFFFEEIDHVLCQAAVRFDHIGDEREDEELEADDEGGERRKEIVPIRCNLEILEIIGEEGEEQANRNRDQDQPRNAEKFEGTDIAYGLEDDASAVVYEAVYAFDDFRFPIGEVGHLYRNPNDTEIFSNSIDDGFLGIGETGWVIESEQCFAIMRPKTTGEVIRLDIEE